MPPPIDTTIAAVRDRLELWRRSGLRVALVPTMGALHQGHLTLAQEAKTRADHVIVSIFVNPTQFGAGEDFERYPRDLAGDAAKLSHLADAIFAPDAGEIYAANNATTVHVEGPAFGLEGASRPHHFDGVATIVTKLLTITAPDVAVFGEKDYQQLLVVKRLAADLNLPVEIIGAATIREGDGLALSSRNAYLSAEERAIAPTLHRTLATAAAAIRAGSLAHVAMEEARQSLRDAGFDLDYCELRDAETLGEVTDLATRPARILVAARLGRTRLIDNIAVEQPA